MSISFPQSIEAAVAAEGDYRAGGTDLQPRRRDGAASNAIIDLRDLPGLATIRWEESGATRIGAKVRIATLATDPALCAAYPGLCAAAYALATPQIRTVATLGGNLLQRTRCWYFRNPATNCLKKGGHSCLARNGNHQHGVCFDQGPCIAPHPSTLGMALLAYEAQVMVHGAEPRTIISLYGDGSDPRRDHLLAPGQLLTSVLLPPPLANECAAYKRITGRAHADWPLAEVLVRLVLSEQRVTFARVSVGGVANTPRRLHLVESELVGRPATRELFARAASAATGGVRPLPQTGYKVQLLWGIVLDTLVAAAQQAAAQS